MSTTPESENNTPDENTETAPVEGEQKPAENPPVEDSENGDDATGEGIKDAAVLTKELERTRRESANYRTQLREAQDALAKAKSPEDFTAAVNELNEKLAAADAALLRERVARKHSLPDALAARLVGKTEAELIADAKALAALVAAPTPERLSGGLDPQDDEVFDAVKVARKARTRR